MGGIGNRVGVLEDKILAALALASNLSGHGLGLECGVLEPIPDRKWKRKVGKKKGL
jgi:hypothetical protein